jgi:hypothetical protein
MVSTVSIVLVIVVRTLGMVRCAGVTVVGTVVTLIVVIVVPGHDFFVGQSLPYPFLLGTAAASGALRVIDEGKTSAIYPTMLHEDLTRG